MHWKGTIALLGTAAASLGFTEPKPGTSERLAILAPLTREIQKKVTQEFLFRVEEIRVTDSHQWAWLRVGLLDNDNSYIPLAGTPYEDQIGSPEDFELGRDRETFAALLRKENGQWKLLFHQVAPSEGEVRKIRESFSTPEGLLGSQAIAETEKAVSPAPESPPPDRDEKSEPGEEKTIQPEETDPVPLRTSAAEKPSPEIPEPPMVSVPAEKPAPVAPSPPPQTETESPPEPKPERDAKHAHPIDLWVSQKEKTIGNSAEAVRLYTEAAHRWEATMGRTFNLMLDSLDVKKAATLVASQELWSAFFNAESELIGTLYPPDRGDDYVAMGAARKMTLVRERSLHLEHAYEILTGRSKRTIEGARLGLRK